MPSPVYVDRTLLVQCGVISSSSDLHTVSGIVPFLEVPCPAVLQTDTNLVLPPMLQNISYNRHWIPSCQIIHHSNWTYESRFCLRGENSPMLCDDNVGEISYTHHFMSERQCSNIMNYAVCLQLSIRRAEDSPVPQWYRVCQNIFDSRNQTTARHEDLARKCADFLSLSLTYIQAFHVVVLRGKLLLASDCENIMTPSMDNVTTENNSTPPLVIAHMAISPIGVLINALGLLVLCRKEFCFQQTYTRISEFFASNLLYLTIPWIYCVINMGQISITDTVSYTCKVGLIAFKVTTNITYIACLVLVVERFVGTCRPRLYPTMTTGKLVAVSMLYMWSKYYHGSGDHLCWPHNQQGLEWTGSTVCCLFISDVT